MKTNRLFKSAAAAALAFGLAVMPVADIPYLPDFGITASAALIQSPIEPSSSADDSGDGWTWDSAALTLTLNGVNFKTNDSNTDDTYGIKLPGGSTIVVNGDNTVIAGDYTGSSYTVYSYGISCSGDLTIKGSGTLDVTGGNSTISNSYGINTVGKLTVLSGTVTAKGGVSVNTCGIRADDDITISGGTVTATGSNNGSTHGIDAHGNMTVSGGTVIATGGDCTSGHYSYGIEVGSIKNLTITGGNVTAKGGDVSSGTPYSYGILADEINVNAEGSTVNASGGAAYYSYGIVSSNNITISKGTVNADGGTAESGGQSYGIKTKRDLTISNGTVNANGGAAGGLSYGIYSNEMGGVSGVTITNAAVTATGADSSSASIGIYCWLKGISINNSDVTATGGVSLDSQGIQAYDAANCVEVIDSTVTAFGESIAISQKLKTSLSMMLGMAADGSDAVNATGTYSSGSALETNSGTNYKYAYITVPEYTVTFEANGGSAVTAQTVKKGKKATKPDDPAKTGHTFGGWYSDAALTTAYDFTAAVTADTTIYAKWTANDYTVTLNANGGTINAGNVTGYTYGVGATLPTDVTKAEHTFGGWYDNAACTGTAVTAISATDTGNKTFYAKWTANDYTVTLNANGGTINAGNVTGYTYGIGATLPTDVTKTGFAFDGWYDNAACTGTAVTAISATDTGNKTFYAKWTINAFTVTFNTNGGSAVAAQTVNYGETAAKPANPTKDGYNFDGWFSDEALTTAYDFDTAVTADITLYAKWTENHTHTYGTAWRSDSTNHWHECSCGDKTDIAAHTEDAGVITTAPTTTSTGVKTYSCTVCGYVIRTETIDKLTEAHTHTYGTEWKHDSTSHWHECSCGEKSDIAAHTENAGVITTAPTAASAGIRTYSCSVCGYVMRTETVAAAAPARYSVNVDINGRGNVTVNKTSAQAGETITVNASSAFGYVLDSIIVNGRAISGSSFTMPAGNANVTVIFKEDYSVYMAGAHPYSYIFCYDSDMTRIKAFSNRRYDNSLDYVEITVKLGEDYAGKTVTIYRGRKSTKAKVETVKLNANGCYTFKVDKAKNYTLVVAD